MRSDSSDDGTTPDLVAEMRAIVDETRKAIEASQAILDRCAERDPKLRAPEPSEPDRSEPEPRDERQDVLGEISDGLLHAYRFAKHDGDLLTVALIEKALFHVGRRLARGMSVTEAGLVRH